MKIILLCNGNKSFSDRICMLIYLAQLSHESNGCNQNRCFPLAVGLIASYLKKEFGEQIEVELFKSVSNLNKAFLRKVPDVLMMSNYMWNSKLTLAFAEEARSHHSDLLIVLGGPNISLEHSKRIEYLKENPAIDIYVVYEGELVSKRIIAEFIKNKDREEVKNLDHPFLITNQTNNSINASQESAVKIRRIGTKESVLSLNDIPSPYLTGLLDKFFEDAELPLIETSRGCPFTCAFCQQGTDFYRKVVHYSTKRVHDEIMYIADKIYNENIDINGIEVADPNFGMYERDRDVFLALRKAQDKTNFPRYIGCSTGKNKADIIIENTSLVQTGTVQLRSSVQSMNNETLNAVMRRNIKQEAYCKIQDAMDSRGIDNLSDIMLGLPLETRKSHFSGILDLIDAGIKEFSCIQTIVLNGTTIESQLYRKKYGIKTKYRITSECCGEYELFGRSRRIGEVEEIIVQTDTMSFEDYLQCRKLHLIIMVFHNTRLLVPVYMFLDYLDIRKSEILRTIINLKDKKLDGLINNFIEDTKKELFDNDEDLDFSSNKAITVNKIFTHLSISLFKYKHYVISALERALMKVLGPGYRQEIVELLQIIEAEVINPFEEIKNQSFQIKSEKLKCIFGSKLKLNISDKQIADINLMNKLYKAPEDKMTKLVYRLRPENLVLKLDYDMLEQFIK